MDCLSEGYIQGIVEGGLDTLERDKAREHLENCAECRKLVGHAAALLASGEAARSELEPLGTAFQPLEPGDGVGRYVVEERLGSGAMGVVYAATDSLLQRDVALKLLRPSDAGGQLDQARLEREARTASAVKHPGVVAVFDVLSTDDGVSVLVMDRLDGVSMRQHLRDRGPLGSAEVRDLFSQILEALAAAHRTGIVHRDLKPENVFLVHGSDAKTQVKLLDFGVAKLLASSFSDSAGLTKSGTLVGTPYYMAPEQAFGATDLDQRADLWAVGVMLFEALVGERPLRGENVGQVLHQLAHFDFGTARARLLEVAPAWEPLVSRLMVERAGRLTDADQALELLRHLDSGLRDDAEQRAEALHGVASNRTEAPHGEAHDDSQRLDVASGMVSVAPLTPKKKSWWAIPVVLGLAAVLALGLVGRVSPSVSELPAASSPAETIPGDSAEARIPTAIRQRALDDLTSQPAARASASTLTAATTAPPAPVQKPRSVAGSSAPRPHAAPTFEPEPPPAPTTSSRKPRLLTEPPF